jgi:hypothetical protein
VLVEKDDRRAGRLGENAQGSVKRLPGKGGQQVIGTEFGGTHGLSS